MIVRNFLMLQIATLNLALRENNLFVINRFILAGNVSCSDNNQRFFFSVSYNIFLIELHFQVLNRIFEKKKKKIEKR